MLDILLFRETPDLVRDSQKKRFKSVELVDKIISLDELWRKTQYQVDQKRKEIGILSKKVGALAKEKAKPEDIEKAKEESRAAKVSLEALEAEVARLKSELDTLIPTVGNIVHPSVPVSNDEANNTIVKTWGDTTKKDGPCEHHHILLAKVDGYDAERGVKVAGHRSYFLKGVGVLLNQALINYGLSFLRKRNYTLLTTPLMMKKAVMSETSQLEDFDEQLYKVGGDYKEEPEKTKGKTAKQIQDEKEEHEKYLIATSEQPISAFHRDENIDPHGLPIKYAGVSTCFRKESGKTGKDVWGIFRVHQFEKVEQFCVTAPEVSWDMHEEMLKTSEEFYQSLGLPYRVVNIVSGELNNAAAKKYDLEGWFPGFNGYRELVSCSNCTDYQSRSLRVKNGLKTNEDHTKRFVHMLNSTLCATTRTICCILENYQTAEGVKVPDVLVPYMDGLTFLPFVRNVQYVDHAAH